MIERFFRSLKEECVWQHNIACFGEVQDAVRRWTALYNEQRPHQSFGYLSLRAFREQQSGLHEHLQWLRLFSTGVIPTQTKRADRRHGVGTHTADLATQ